MLAEPAVGLRSRGVEERLQKVLAKWGIASRRHAETLIESRRVQVNGQVAYLGQKADPAKDRIELDGRVLSSHNRPDHYYFLLNKPKQVVSSCADPQGRKTVLAFLPRELRHSAGLHPVGRLDFNSTGALLMTNDGDLTCRLTHPRHHIPKVYRVTVAGRPSSTALQRWQRGIMLDGRPTLPAKVTVLTAASGATNLEVVLSEGRNRQIRRVAAALGHPVKRLHRTAIGPIQLQQLAPGHRRELTSAEIAELNRILDRIATI